MTRAPVMTPSRSARVGRDCEGLRTRKSSLMALPGRMVWICALSTSFSASTRRAQSLATEFSDTKSIKPALGAGLMVDCAVLCRVRRVMRLRA